VKAWTNIATALNKDRLRPHGRRSGISVSSGILRSQFPASRRHRPTYRPHAGAARLHPHSGQQLLDRDIVPALVLTRTSAGPLFRPSHHCFSRAPTSRTAAFPLRLSYSRTPPLVRNRTACEHLRAAAPGGSHSLTDLSSDAHNRSSLPPSSPHTTLPPPPKKNLSAFLVISTLACPWTYNGDVYVN